ncbi:MAG: DUF5658 family protein [Candidatus Pacebacteria bacterium]|nr:DUF5658 family protein [Candidatus Paceibacterota bacterium]
MEKEKLINSFVAANIADSALTWVALDKLNFQEVNIVAQDMISNGGIERVLLFKFAITSLLILFYALTNHSESRFAYSSEKALQIGNVIIWIAVLSNLLQITMEIA